MNKKQLRFFQVILIIAVIAIVYAKLQEWFG